MKYWNGEGQYQDLFDKYWKELVPDRGEADTDAGNALRAIARINHDVFNNGAGNIVNESMEVDDDGEWYTLYEVERWWRNSSQTSTTTHVWIQTDSSARLSRTYNSTAMVGCLICLTTTLTTSS